jgi:hypothetical protein
MSHLDPFSASQGTDHAFRVLFLARGSHAALYPLIRRSGSLTHHKVARRHFLDQTFLLFLARGRSHATRFPLVRRSGLAHHKVAHRHISDHTFLFLSRESYTARSPLVRRQSFSHRTKHRTSEVCHLLGIWYQVHPRPRITGTLVKVDRLINILKALTSNMTRVIFTSICPSGLLCRCVICKRGVFLFVCLQSVAIT